MICKRGYSFTDRLSSRSKRLFILLLVCSAILTYVLYGNTSRNSRRVKLTRLDSLKNSNNKSIISSDVTGATVRPGRLSNHLQHVAAVESSDFKTTLTSSKVKQISTELFEEETESGTPEDLGHRGQKSSHVDEYSSKGVDKDGNYSVSSAASSTQGDRKRLLNFKSQVEDDGDSDASEFELEEGENGKRLPNAIIIGVKKGGTRALLEILKIHPSVRACSSEVHFFDRDENYEQGLEWYREQMPTSSPGQITIEKSPSYFITSKVPERVYRMSKSVKVIVIVRDPTRRAISDYTQSRERKPDNPPFEEMVIKDNGDIDEEWSKIAFGRYAEHLTHWLEYFPSSQIHFVSGEELIKRPAKEIKLVERFLNLKPFIAEKNFYFNESKGFPCFVGKITNSGSVSKAHCMGETKGRKHPAIRGDVLKRLREYFRPLNEKFYSMVQRNFHW
ncbi:hypothetical protein OS493_017856 [Desmophyllum pertusum]|uniref:Sulfotransferase domain-containing protein n=1 Tax=Desmophyllum pertusum TaxID=174260 RepID=A0A9X0CR42_9CNID|nr:hypothetical protein OS493_017856 [Desmophyllum pertusum]